jgi:methylated-DNA-protein-cysteine methyltransferase-like protein
MVMDVNDDAERKLYQRIYQVVQQVPRGRVATYGDIAAIVGEGCDARTVGYALHELPKGHEQSIPWQRIINGAGRISTHGPLQRRLLEAEGVVFDARERVNLARFRWTGPNHDWARAHGFTPLPARNQDEQDEQDEQGEQLHLF